MEQLLRYFKPEEYKLELYLSRKHEEIKGRATIRGEIQLDSQAVKFHAVNMQIKSVRLDLHNNFSPDFDYHDREVSSEAGVACEFEYDGKTLKIPITEQMKQDLAQEFIQREAADEPDYSSNVVFVIDYVAKINRNMEGCYLSTYEWHGQERKIITTQFESHYAREAFPCIDEPAAKAAFDLHLVVMDLGERDVVLANTPVQCKVDNRFSFACTPKMSTYLLAWVIGPFQSVSSVNRDGVVVSSYCALNQDVEELLFANQTAMRTLEYYNDLFDEKYPLPKLDQVALPDFEAGAMENWGLVTYRESMMLADAKSPLDLKRTVTTTVTHELSHQWFGDLVTMAWWDDLWLNESFATIMEYYCADALYPELDNWQDFYTGDCLAALKRDCLPGVQAVKQAVKSPAEIATLFDGAIVYAKGARLILMLIKIMGEEAFFKGIRHYFNEYKYENTVGDDLWNCLQPFAKFKVKEFMDAWISQPGYPALKHSGEKWQQQRFLINGETNQEQWPLPEVFDDMSGHYLIELADQAFQSKLGEFNNLELGQKIRLLVDRMLLARARKVPSASLLDLLQSAGKSELSAVWDILASIINDLKLFCPVGSESYRDYQKFLRQLIAPALAKVGLIPAEGEDSDTTTLRNILLGIARYAEDEAVMQQLADLYQDNLLNINSELRDYVLSSKLFFAEQEGDSKFFDELLQKYIKATNSKVKADLRITLASARLEKNTAKMLELLERPDIVRPQDHVFLFVYLMRNSYTREQTLDWLITHWSYVVKMAGEKSVEDYLRYTAGGIREPAEAEKFFAFFDMMATDAVLARAIKMAHTEIASRLELIAEESPAVQQKLRRLL